MDEDVAKARQKLSQFATELRELVQYWQEFQLAPGLSPDLTRWLTRAIRQYLDGKSSLDAALGLKPPKRRPKGDPRRHKQHKKIAPKIEALRAQGKTWEAVADALIGERAPLKDYDLRTLQRIHAKWRGVRVSRKVNERLAAGTKRQQAKRVAAVKKAARQARSEARIKSDTK